MAFIREFYSLSYDSPVFNQIRLSSESLGSACYNKRKNESKGTIASYI